MDKIIFKVNGNECSVGSEVDSDASLNDYLRSVLELRGTKYMCKEGGCGACVVAVTVRDRGLARTMAVNSCLVSVTSCQDWEVTTIEGIGDRRTGYHPLQKTLAEYNGTQCGYCSPGWVMNMYSLLESNEYNLTQYEIENSFGSNTCRCTGFRPILDAFKSFAKDAPEPNLQDIEELTACKKTCKKKCEAKCQKDWCVVEKEVEFQMKKIHLKDDRIWYRVNKVSDVFNILNNEGYESYMLVNGNTGRGAVPIFSFPRVLIDISQIDDLKVHYIDQNLVVGAGTTLTDLMTICKKVSQGQEAFAYLEKFYEHLDLVAHIPVRNIGTIAGNLMVKHKEPKFSSDIFLLLESVGATLVIVDKTKTVEVVPEKFLTLDMTGRIITQIKLPPLSVHCRFVSFKIMPRAQNAHAQVNAAFLYELDSKRKEEFVLSSRIVITGLSGKFIHARKTEKYLVNKKLFTNEVLQEALKILVGEVIVEEIPADLKPEYRKKCALGLFYKSLLNLIPKGRLKPRYRSGARDFRKTRPLSKGTEVYDTNPATWPVTEPMPKVEALIQCAGEAFYVNDLPSTPNEVFCAFVPADVAVGEIVEIDPTPALKLPGVLAFFSAKDIPGLNTYVFPDKVPLSSQNPQEIFADRRVKYYDQPIGVIVAETEKLANRAALLVRTKYRDVKKPVLTIKDARETDPSRVSLFVSIPARDRGLNVQRVIKGTDKIFYQYHFSMETQSCVTRPNDDGVEVFPSTQWPDLTQTAVAEVLKIEQSRVNVTIPRCGGAYGAKISCASHIAAACSLVSYLMNRPCRFVMSIQANLRIVGKRPPCTRDYEVGVNDSGEIQYLEYHIFDDNGYVLGDFLISYCLPAIKNCYDNRRWQMNLFNVITDTASNTYCRAPGTTEAIAMTEYIMERISYELGMDPLQVRLNNLNPNYPDVAEVTQTLVRDSEYYNRRKEIEAYNKMNRWKKRGLGVALMSYAVSAIVGYHVVLTVFHGDATVVIRHGGVEIGQGCNTNIIQAVAYTLNIPMSKIKVKPTDVTHNPNSFTTGGSRTTQAVCFAAIKCCQLLQDRLNVVRETMTDPTWETLIQTAYLQGINLQTSYQVTSNDQEPYRAAGATFTEVELDILTGEHEVLRVDLIEDVGTSLNPELDIGQIEGAFIMGMGYWTSEHILYEEKTGELLTDRTWYYKVPLAKDIPLDFRVQLRRNSYNPIGVLGGKAVSEPATTMAVSVGFALREAIAASREDTGIPRNKWFDVEGPYSLENNVLKAEARLDEFLFN